MAEPENSKDKIQRHLDKTSKTKNAAIAPPIQSVHAIIINKRGKSILFPPFFK